MLTVSADWTKEFIVQALQNYRYYGRLEHGDKKGYEHYQILIDNHDAIAWSTLNNKFPINKDGSRKGSFYFEEFKPIYKGRPSSKQDCFNYVDKGSGEIISNGNWNDQIRNKAKGIGKLTPDERRARQNAYLDDLRMRITVGGEDLGAVLLGEPVEVGLRYRRELENQLLDYLSLADRAKYTQLLRKRQAKAQDWANDERQRQLRLKTVSEPECASDTVEPM